MRAIEKLASASELLGSTSKLLGSTSELLRSMSELLRSTSELLGSIAMNVMCSSFLRACICKVKIERYCIYVHNTHVFQKFKNILTLQYFYTIYSTIISLVFYKTCKHIKLNVQYDFYIICHILTIYQNQISI